MIVTLGIHIHHLLAFKAIIAIHKILNKFIRIDNASQLGITCTVVQVIELIGDLGALTNSSIIFNKLTEADLVDMFFNCDIVRTCEIGKCLGYINSLMMINDDNDDVQ